MFRVAATVPAHARLLGRRHVVTWSKFSGGPSPALLRETSNRISVADFRRIAHVGDEPAVFRERIDPVMEDGITTIPKGSSNGPRPIPFPAAHNWFADSDLGVKLPTPRFKKHLNDVAVPYELILDPHGSPVANDGQPTIVARFLKVLKKSRTTGRKAMYQLLEAHLDREQLRAGHLGTGFVRFHAPLSLLYYALWYNAPSEPAGRVSQLYIAQLPLTDLPDDLRGDVPTPLHLADFLAPGDSTLPEQSLSVDIYNSSLWLGLEPTFTPWHRDPNPNLLCQLIGAKKIRFAPPPQGDELLRDVAARMGRPADGRSAIRGEDMMARTQREAELEAVWGPDARDFISEVVLEPGDMMYIPTGWWHSVVSDGPEKGQLNMSVNWWFRTRVPRPRG